MALLGLVLLSPLLLVIGLLVYFESRGGVFYLQERIGKGEQVFKLYKFRTMYPDSDRKGLLTIGNRDSRITRVGYFLRKYKLDELPQLINVLIGEMSIVGPRPEVKKYVDLYTPQQRKVLQIRPGITDYASLAYMDENEILAKSPNPEQSYIEDIMPRKLALNLKYVADQSFLTDLKIIFKTIGKIFGRRG